MALARAFPPFPVCSTGIEVPCTVLVQLKQYPISNTQNAGLLWALPRNHRRSQSRGDAGARLRASVKVRAEGQVKAASEPNGEKSAEPGLAGAEGKKKPSRSKRKPKSKTEDSAPSVAKEVTLDKVHVELPTRNKLVATIESSSQDVVDLSLESTGLLRGGGDSITRKSLVQDEVSGTKEDGPSGVSITSSEASKDIGNLEETHQERKNSLRRSARRSKKAVEILTVSDAVSAVEREEVGRLSETLETSDKTEEKNGIRTPRTKRRSKGKPIVLDDECGPQELLTSSGCAEDLTATQNLVSGGCVYVGVEQTGVGEGSNDQGSSKVRKRSRRKKRVEAPEKIDDRREENARDKKGDSEGSEIELQFSQGSLGASSKLQKDGGSEEVVKRSAVKIPDLEYKTSSGSLTSANDKFESAGREDSLWDGEVQNELQRYPVKDNTFGPAVKDNTFGPAVERKANRSDGEAMDSHCVLPSFKTDSKIPTGVTDDGALRSDDSPDGEIMPTRRRRKKRLQKKKGPGSLQSKSDSEMPLPGTEDVFDTIIWCTVHLKVQAELEDNERLYVVGANPELGAWDLSLALPLPESRESLWGNTFKVPRGTMLEYKYFTEKSDAESLTVERRFGPEIQYFLPWKEGQGSESEVISDIWIPDVPAKLPVLSWGDRWWEEIHSLDTEGGNLEDDEEKRRYGPQELDQEVDTEEIVLTEQESVDASREVEVDTEEVEVEEWLKKKIRKKVFPREEPWLMESMIMTRRDDYIRKKSAHTEATIQATETSEAEQKEPTVQVEILINSPQCSMQRMAILEDGKLVELLLEPVNTRVQVGNVYLGVVKQLLPGMTGVFVDIGGFQLALLDITRNQYPYTFPSIGQFSTDVANGSVNSSENEEDSHDAGTESEFEDDEEEEEEGEDEDEEDDEDEADGEDVDLEEAEGIEDYSAIGRSVHEAPVNEDKIEDQYAKGPHAEIAVSRSVNFGRKLTKWRKLREGMHMIVQVKKEALGKKGPRLTAFPSLAGRFWVLVPGARSVGVSRRITGPERKRLKELAQELQPKDFGLTVRTEAVGLDHEELEKDLARLIETWKEVLERASAAAVAAERGMEGAVPVLLHRAMGQTLRIVRDFFNDKVHRMVIDSPQCYQEVTSYLQEVAPQLCDRVELYTHKLPIFDTYNIESVIDGFSSKRVNLPNGGYLVMEETEALVSVDVNGGTGMLAHNISQEEAILAVNLAAARQIATELRLRDIGGIIVVDFIDMEDPKNEKLVYDEMRKAISRDRSSLNMSEISEFGLMEMTRKRVRPSVTFTISDPCTQCGGVGRVEAHETTLSKIERAVRRVLASRRQKKSSNSSRWPQILLRVDPVLGEYLKGRKRKRITQLSSALKAWLNLKVALEFSLGQFQVLEQQRSGSEGRSNGAGQTKPNQQIGPGLLGKRVWPGKRRKNFGSQLLKEES